MKKICRILYIIGIILLISGLIINYYKNHNTNQNDKIHNKEEKTIVNEKQIPITKYSEDLSSELMISKFQIKKDDDNVQLSFTLNNKTNEDLINKFIYVNFYSKNNEVDYIYKYEIGQLDIDDSIIVDTTISIKEYQKVSISYDEFETDITK